MPGYVTDERSLGFNIRVDRSQSDGFADFQQTFVPGSQKTRSYRSGVRGPSEQEELLQDSHLTRRITLNSQHDTGHEFDSTKIHLEVMSHPNARVVRSDRNGRQTILTGPLVLQSTGLHLMEGELRNLSDRTSSNDVNVYGARAINATMPTKANANLANFLAELTRDGIPSIVSGLSRIGNGPHRGFAEDYLNAEFGWGPLFQDIKAICESVKNSSRTIKQMRRDSGRTVRRRFRFPIESSYNETLVGVSSPSYSPVFGMRESDFDSFGDMRTAVQDATRVETWFSGAYTYYLDMGDDLISRFARYEQLANKLLGTRLTPSVLWEAAPWSWLVDWFADVGTVLDNASALQSDGLVIRYGYLMRKTTVTRTMSAMLPFYYGPTFRTSNIWTATRKQRWKATPYGFGLLDSDFTARQWAILAALGMTRSPRVVM